MTEQQPDIQECKSRVDQAKLVAKKAIALAGATGVAMFSSTSSAQASRSEQFPAKNKTPTYLTQEVKSLHQSEGALLKAIREKRHPAKIWNGALEFHGETTAYVSPADNKHRVFYDRNRPSSYEFTAYYPMVVPIGGALWAAIFDNHHSQANVGQGSNTYSIAWIPLGETRFTGYQNVGDGAGPLLNFHEVYDPNPVGEGVASTPVYNIFADGTNPQLPRSDAIMDTEIWPASQAKANIKAAGFKQLSKRTTSSALRGFAKHH